MSGLYHDLPIAFVLVGWIGFALGFIRRPHHGTAVRRSPASIVGLLIQALAVGIVWGWRRPAGASFLPGAAAGMAVVVATFLLAAATLWLGPRAIAELGKQWSLEARVLDGHELVITGPYRVVRHPIYTALLCMVIATGLAFSTPAALGAAIVLYLVGSVVRIRSEEQLLRAVFGAAHADYTKRVPALVPWLHL